MTCGLLPLTPRRFRGRICDLILFRIGFVSSRPFRPQGVRSDLLVIYHIQNVEQSRLRTYSTVWGKAPVDWVSGT